MNKLFASLLLALGLLSAVSDAQQTPQQEYIHKYASIAQAEMRRTGVPASITLAQGLLESGAGLSTLAVKSNNHFGIKCHKNWKGKKVYHDDDAKGECFRSYSKPEESFRDHSDFLRYNDRYKFLFDYDISDYRSWCYGLKQAGYATDPKYATKLIDLIETYGLGRYDVGKVEVEAPDKIEAPVKSAIQYDEEFRFKVERTVYEKNGVRFAGIPMPPSLRSMTFSRLKYSDSTTLPRLRTSSRVTLFTSPAKRAARPRDWTCT